MKTSIKNILNSKTNLTDRFIPDYADLREVVIRLKEMGYRIVLTQGVYDLVHEGHALYLEKARSYGDILIVGVDSDDFTKRRKGPRRPVVPQGERVKMLIHFRHVDIVTLRESHHGMGVKNDLVEAVRPDVFVVSQSTEDFAEESVLSFKNLCGEIVSLPPQATTSTTARIRTLTIDGADQFLNLLMAKIPELYKDVFER